MTTEPILVDLAQYDTHPVLTWTVTDESGTVISMAPATRTVELYYFDSRSNKSSQNAFWKITLTKSVTPSDGKVTFTPDATHPYYPQSVLDGGGGSHSLVGWLRLHDTASSPVVNKWIKNALVVFITQPPDEPV